MISEREESEREISEIPGSLGSLPNLDEESEKESLSPYAGKEIMEQQRFYAGAESPYERILIEKLGFHSQSAPHRSMVLLIEKLGEKQERVYEESADQLNYFTDKLFKREDSKYRLLDERLRMMGREVENITKRINRIDGALRIVRRGVENNTERIDRIENNLLRREVEIENIIERIDRMENDLTEHIYKPLVKGIGISTALLGILLAVSSSILAIPAFIISYLCFWGLWKSKKS